MHPKKILFFIIGVLVALFTMTLFSSYHITDNGARGYILWQHYATVSHPRYIGDAV